MKLRPIRAHPCIVAGSPPRRAGAAAADAPSEEESKTDRMERRARETSEVELRVKSVADADELMRELEGDQLVVLEVVEGILSLKDFILNKKMVHSSQVLIYSFHLNLPLHRPRGTRNMAVVQHRYYKESGAR